MCPVDPKLVAEKADAVLANRLNVAPSVFEQAVTLLDGVTNADRTASSYNEWGDVVVAAGLWENKLSVLVVGEQPEELANQLVPLLLEIKENKSVLGPEVFDSIIQRARQIYDANISQMPLIVT